MSQACERETQKRETACVGLPEPPAVTTVEVPAEPLPAAPPAPLAAGHSQGVSRFARACSGPSGRRFLPSSGRVAF